MKKIWKHTIPQDEMRLEVTGPGLNPLHVGTPQGQIDVWIERDDTRPERTIELQVFGTGHVISEEMERYVGTFKLLDGAFIGHIYARQLS